MPIWFDKNLSLQPLQQLNAHTMGEYIGLEFTEVGEDFIKATLPVDHRTWQPYHILHGGANSVLAETLGSMASAMVVDHSQYLTLGIEINCNHLRPAKEGLVTGICKPIQLGKTLHVWEIKIYNERNKLTCISRLTVMIKLR
ncbi:MAG: hotdog fold thioesterase [Bacteroidetes bacterium]|nr:hotdog fold thioesterase [Bacteroidota bacterium]